MKVWIRVAVAMTALGCSAAANFGQAGQPTAAEKKSATTIVLPPSPKALLPDAFDGWVSTGQSKTLADVSQADAANAAALKEYGYETGIENTYKRDGDTVTVRALGFQDASGAYGAYSFYRQSGWPKESIGTGAASSHNRVLFWLGTTVVDANFSKVDPTTAGSLREIAKSLPIPTGNRGIAPPILANLPQTNIEGQTTHYAEGPAGYAGAGGVLPPSLVDFDKGAETVTATYSLTSGPATLTIIDYPTPQIAAAQENAISAYLKAGSQAQPAWPKPLQDSDVASLEVRHSGPIVVVVSGDAIPDESHRLLESVHYEADLTGLPQAGTSDVQKTSELLLGIATIVIVGGGTALFFGGFLGGGRALWRIAHGKPASSLYDEEIIYLNLRDKPSDSSAEAPVTPNPKG